METVETHLKESQTVSVTQSLLHITENLSVTGIMLLQSNEFFRQAKSKLKILEQRIRSLKDSRIETVKTRDALLVRNKVNITNLESLFQTQSEFYNYKCEMKTNYIIAEEMAKNKKQRYEIITAEYQAKWTVVERECQEMPLAAQLAEIQNVNAALWKESIGLEEKLSRTKSDFFQELKNLQSHLTRKIVEFSKEYLAYVKVMHLNKEIREKRSNIKESVRKFKIPDMGAAEQATVQQRFMPSALQLHSRTLSNVKKSEFSVDLTAFDKMLIPFESLEIQNDDDTYPYQKRNVSCLKAASRKEIAEKSTTITSVRTEKMDLQASAKLQAETKRNTLAETCASMGKYSELTAVSKKQTGAVAQCESETVSQYWSLVKKKDSLLGYRRPKTTMSETSKPYDSTARAKVKFCDWECEETEISLAKKIKASTTCAVPPSVNQQSVVSDIKEKMLDQAVRENVPSSLRHDQSTPLNNSTDAESNKSNFWLWPSGEEPKQNNENPGDGKFTFFTEGTGSKKTTMKASSSIFNLF